MVNTHLNAGISHNSKDWLMWLTIESERTKKRLSLERRCRFNNSGCRYWYIDSAMFDSLKLFSSTHVTSVGPIAPKSVDFRVLGVKTPLRA
jgi:hypothetical protein